jgi:hypothetical protein
MSSGSLTSMFNELSARMKTHFVSLTAPRRREPSSEDECAMVSFLDRVLRDARSSRWRSGSPRPAACPTPTRTHPASTCSCPSAAGSHWTASRWGGAFLQTDKRGTTSGSDTDEGGRYELSYRGEPGTAAADKVAVSYKLGRDGVPLDRAARFTPTLENGAHLAKERVPR